MMRAPRSLRLKLLLLLLTLVAAAWSATAVFSFLDARHEMDEIFDAQLAQTAKLLLAQADHDIEDLQGRRDGVASEVRSDDHKYERKLAFQVWDDHGILLVRSEGAPEQPLSPVYAGAGPHAPDEHPHPGGTPRGRFDDVESGDHRWRVFSHWNQEGEILVQVGERADMRQELAAHIALRLLGPLAFTLPLLGILIWLAVGEGLAPLRRIGAEVASRAPDNLVPLESGAVPTEIAPLVASLNTLLRRLADALDNERRFTADAAHELRTPLAALKTHAQVALRAADEVGRKSALESVLAGADRAAHLVEQLLTLARQVIADLGPAALAKNLDLELSGDGTVAGHGPMLAILLRNLVDNAVRYTPPGGAVRVSIAKNPDGVTLTVRDSGPGIPAEERQRVFDRFYRVLGNEAPGSGLGLSIVKRIADLHRAELSLADGEGGHGLTVTVRFPRLA